MLHQRELVEPLPLRDGARVLEIGAGDGETSAEVARWFRAAGLRAQVVALDFDAGRGPGIARTAEGKGVGDMVRFVLADACSLPDLGGGFDVILSVNSLSQIVLEGDGRALRALDDRARRAIWPQVSLDAVRECTRPLLARWKERLAPGGQLVVMDVDGEPRDEAHARGLLLYQQRKWPPIPGSLVRSLLADVGFSRVVSQTANELSFEHEQSAEARAWLGAPHGERLVTPPASIGPPPVVRPEGPCAITMTLSQAWA